MFYSYSIGFIYIFILVIVTGDLVPAFEVCQQVCTCTVKPVLNSHSKIDKTKVLKTNGSLKKVESIAECSLGAFCNTLTCIKR